jgi:ribulose-5-phosphate 4-epimerase/fuculose-1-phosphate aldolase
MCGIVGVVSNAPVNQLIYDALLLLQHRGQDAAGIVTQQEEKFFMHKAKGMVKDVFRTRNMRALPGNCGLGQVRYPTAGNAFSEEEAQPFYVNAPFGIVMVHNGNLTNAHALKRELFTDDHRHINTDSDSEVLLNVLAHELERTSRGSPLQAAHLFAAVRNVHARVKGSYAVIALIAGHGVLAFRDPHGIRPLCIGRSADNVVLASESVALEGTLHQFERNIDPGEAVFVNLQGEVLDGSRYPVKPAGFTVHAAIHDGVPEAHCVMHTHTTAGVAVACLQGGLQQTNFYSAQLHDMVAYHAFEGITIHADEAPRLLRSMGTKPALILRNHGLLAWGQSLPQTFAILWTLQRACEIQLATFSMGAAIPVSEAVAAKCTRDALQFNPNHGAGRDVFEALVRQVRRVDESYAL